MITRALAVALPIAMAVGWPTAAAAQESRPLNRWLGEQFLTVARTCLPASSTNLAPERYIPADVRSWDTFANRLEQNVPIYSLDSLGSYFSNIYLRGDNGSLSRNGMQPLGVTYAENEATALYSRTASGIRQHNCSTMLSASGDINIPLSANVFRAAINTSVTESRSQSIYLYSGRIVSPVAAALGLASTEVDRRPNVDRFSVYLAAWNWYRLHPSMVEPGNQARLEITRVIDGAAAYRMTGLTQAVLMSGNARIGAAIPFVSASAEASGSGNASIRQNTAGFGVAVLNRHPGATFPGAVRLSADAPLLANVTPVATNPTSIDGAQPIQWSADLSGVPTAYCDRIFWQLAAAPNRANTFDYSNFTVQPAPEGARVCRFTVRATPTANATSNVARLAFSVSTSIPGVGADVAPPLTIPLASTDIADYRASISLANPQGDLAYTLNAEPNGPPLSVPLTYIVREKDGRRATEVISGSAILEVACGQAQPQSVPLGPQDITFGRSNGEGRITLTARIPRGSIFGPDEAVASCGLGGLLVVGVEGAAPRTLTLPTHAFTVSAPAPAPTMEAR